MKIAFFEIEDWEIDYIKTQIGIDAELFFTKEKLDKDSIKQFPSDFDIISVFVESNINKDVINYFSNLKLITTRSTGFDHIDLVLVKKKGVAVGYVPGYGDNTVAEFAFGLILALSRKICEAYDRIRKGNFSLDSLQGFDLKSKTIGIIGTGRIGRYMIQIAKGFDMNVIAYDPFPNKQLANEIGFKYLGLEDLLSQSDIVSLHVPYLPLTHHLINKDNIFKIKKGALLINTSRGAVIETDALASALDSGHLAGVGLDVLEEEGAIQDEKTLLLKGRTEEHNLKTVLTNHLIIEMPNAIVTPHNAFNTKEALQRILDTDINNIKSFADKKIPVFLVPDNS